MIIAETLDQLRTTHGDVLASARLSRLVVGVFFTVAQLSDGHCGIARTQAGEELAGLGDRPRDLGEFAPGRLQGRPILEILEHEDDRPLFASIQLAVWNAVSARLIAASDYRIVTGRDPLEWIDASAGHTVVMVGAFPSFMDQLARRPCTLKVLELDPAAFPERHRGLYVPAERAAEVLPEADSVILTGSTLVNHTLDDLLALVPPHAFTALVGPSGGLLPDALFRRGIRLIATIRILDAERTFTIIGEGGAAYHLFRTCAEKICILHE